jgi:hypothetical protein
VRFSFYRMLDNSAATGRLVLAPFEEAQTRVLAVNPGREKHERYCTKPDGERSVIECFDDLAVGMRFKSSEKVVTREEIKRFASGFDPQPYHLDEAAAEQTPLRGLAASGWHTAGYK